MESSGIHLVGTTDCRGSCPRLPGNRAAERKGQPVLFAKSEVMRLDEARPEKPAANMR